MNKKVIYSICALINLIIPAIFLMYWLIGSHGQFRFRPHMFEDWLFLGATIPWLLLAAIFIRKIFKKT